MDNVADLDDEVRASLDVATAEVGPRAPSVLVWLSAAVVAAFVAWAWWAIIDEVAIGVGKVIPAQRVQQIQSLEGGILSELNVSEGQVVEAGEQLAVLDSTRWKTSYEETAARVRALMGAEVRLRAQLGEAPLVFPPEVRAVREVVEREVGLYESRKASLASALSHLERSYQLAVSEARLTEEAARKGAASDVEVLRIRRQANDLQARMNELRSDFVVKAREELQRVQGELETLRQVAAGRADVLARTSLVSPVKGVVKDIETTTLGGVVAPGARLMEVVPLGDELMIETQIGPADIAFLHTGLPARVEITAYDRSIYGDLAGVVDRVSPDTIKDEVHPDRYYYRVYVKTHEASLVNKAGMRFEILPGMVANVAIQTGRRSVLDALLKPLNRAREALRTR